MSPIPRALQPRVLVGLLLAIATPAGARPQAPGAPVADLSGVEQFWRIAALLQAGREPPEAMWDSLFRTPGYAALEARERRRAALTAGIRAALFPANRALRDSLLAANGWAARVVRHIETVPARRAQLDALAERFRREGLLAGALARTATLLPLGVTAKYGAPPVAFVFFLPDGRGYPSLIVADLARVASAADPTAFFAHEATHFYWARLAAERERTAPLARGPGPERLAALLMKIAEESAGDQFDKLDALTEDSAQLARRHRDPGFLSYLAQYHRELAGAEVQLRRLDLAIVAMGAHPDAMERLADSASDALPLEGRPVGMYLAQAIRRELGDARFAAIAGDPIGYFLAYQEAASRPSCRCVKLSAAAVQVIDALRPVRR